MFLAVSAGVSGGACGNDDGFGTPAPLRATDWRLVEVASDGELWRVPEDRPSHLHISASDTFGVVACNHTGGKVEASATTLRLVWSRQQTLIGCLGDGARLESAVTALFGRDLGWTVTSDELVLRRAGAIEARYARDVGFPTDDLEVLDRSPGRALWQVGFRQEPDRSWLQWEGRRQEGEGWASAGMAPNGSAADGMIVGSGPDTVVFGFVPAQVASAAFVTEQGERELALVEVGLWKVFGQRSAFPDASGVIVGRGADGAELFRSRELPAPPGSP